MARSDPQVNFRIPQELKEKLENAAKESGRSITSELVTRLEQSFLKTKSYSESHELPLFIRALSQQMDKQGTDFNEFKKLLLGTFEELEKFGDVYTDDKKPTP